MINDNKKVMHMKNSNRFIAGPAAAFDFKGHLSHRVGLSVHDAGNYRNRKLEPGMVLTIDPMIWVPE